MLEKETEKAIINTQKLYSFHLYIVIFIFLLRITSLISIITSLKNLAFGESLMGSIARILNCRRINNVESYFTNADR